MKIKNRKKITSFLLVIMLLISAIAPNTVEASSLSDNVSFAAPLQLVDVNGFSILNYRLLGDIGGACDPEKFDGKYSYYMDIRVPFVSSSGSTLTNTYSVTVPKVEGGEVEFSIVGFPEYTFPEVPDRIIDLIVKEIKDEDGDVSEYQLKECIKLYRVLHSYSEQLPLNIPLEIKKTDNNSDPDVKFIGYDYIEEYENYWNAPLDDMNSVLEFLQQADYTGQSMVKEGSLYGKGLVDSEGKTIDDYVRTFEFGVDEKIFAKISRGLQPEGFWYVGENGKARILSNNNNHIAINMMKNDTRVWENGEFYPGIDLSKYDFKGYSAYQIDLIKFFALNNVDMGYYEIYTKEEQDDFLKSILDAIEKTDNMEDYLLTAPYMTVRVKYTIPIEKAEEMTAMTFHSQLSRREYIYGQDPDIVRDSFSAYTDSGIIGFKPMIEPHIIEQIESKEITWNDVFNEFVNPQSVQSLTDDKGVLLRSLILGNRTYMNGRYDDINKLYIEPEVIDESYAKHYNLHVNPGVYYITDPNDDYADMLYVKYRPDKDCDTKHPMYDGGKIKLEKKNTKEELLAGVDFDLMANFNIKEMSDPELENIITAVNKEDVYLKVNSGTTDDNGQIVFDRISEDLLTEELKALGFDETIISKFMRSYIYQPGMKSGLPSDNELVDYTWKLVEKEAPNGYLDPEDDYIIDDIKNDLELTVELYNEKAELPITGSYELLIITLVGGFAILATRKRKRR